MKQLTFVSFVVLLLIGCRKDTLQDRLEGDAANFIGKWEWTHSIREVVHSVDYSEFIMSTPETSGNTYQLEFKEEGIAIISKDGEEQGRYRMDFNGPSTDSEKVTIHGTLYRTIGDEQASFRVTYKLTSKDSMQFWYYPFNFAGGDGNHYKRIQ